LASRFIAGASGFLTFARQSIQPERYGKPSRLNTISSQAMCRASFWLAAATISDGL
jgi:hypothetical protein